MAKKFDKAASSRAFTEVARASAEKANVITIKMISNEKLHDYSQNHEDIQDTADLENSITELGFTDPIEVTNFGQSEGNYTIVSGHRRRVAGVKCGLQVFPCIVKTFTHENEIHNYVLLANSQRDSAKDPLLFAARYKMHEQYLIESGFKGNKREEIARRLGISIKHADRFSSFNKIILPIWDMVRAGNVGMSSMLPMAAHTPSEQEEILDLLNQFSDSGKSLTRENIKFIIECYRDGKRTLDEIESKPILKDSSIPLNAVLNTELDETKDNKDNHNNDIKREFDPIATEADRIDKENAKWEKEQSLKNEEPEKENSKDPKDPKPPLSNIDKAIKIGDDIMKLLTKLDNCFSNIYDFEDDKKAKEALMNMSKVFEITIDEMYNVSNKHNLSNIFKDEIIALERKITDYK